MKSRLTALRNGIGIIFLSFFLHSCTTEETIIPQSHTVEIRAMKFQPAELLVKKGDTVIFVNQDILVHDVTEEKPKGWKSQPLATGQSYRMVVNESSNYYCSIHPVMKGKLLTD